MSKKYHLALDDYEHSLFIHALNDKRNELIKMENTPMRLMIS